jgi:hypothetical protein
MGSLKPYEVSEKNYSSEFLHSRQSRFAGPPPACAQWRRSLCSFAIIENNSPIGGVVTVPPENSL